MVVGGQRIKLGVEVLAAGGERGEPLVGDGDLPVGLADRRGQLGDPAAAVLLARGGADELRGRLSVLAGRWPDPEGAVERDGDRLRTVGGVAFRAADRGEDRGGDRRGDAAVLHQCQPRGEIAVAAGGERERVAVDVE